MYNDNFAMSSKESDIAEGTRDDEGNPLQRNQQSSNRYHANWLNMMYPRIKVAKDLLTDDGVIFISIDDNEVENLRKVCNEIFGEENFVAQLTTVMNLKGNNDEFGFAGTHEYTIVYMKSKYAVEDLNGIPLTDDDISEYKLSDEKGKFKKGATLMRTGEAGARFKRPKGYYPIYVSKDLSSINIERQSPDDYEVFPKTVEGKEMSWRRSPDFLMKTRNEFIITKTVNGISFNKKQRLSEDMKKGKKAKTLFYKPEYSSGNGTSQIKDLFEGRIFDNPKPLALIKDILCVGSTSICSDEGEENTTETNNTTNQSSTILDFFSGSATTAHAVMQLNAEDGGNRKFIMVQLPEETEESSEAFKKDYSNICEIGKDRIRRAGEKIKEEIETANAQLKIGEEPKQVPDIGFKVFRTADTNIKWNLYDALGQLDTSAMTHTPDFADFTMGFKDIDVVYEVMLRQKDVPLSSTLETLTDIGRRTYLYGSTYLVCLETEITEELIDKLAALDPLPIKFVFRDSAFKDDINLKDETFRRLKNLIERNSGLEKKSYTVEFI